MGSRYGHKIIQAHTPRQSFNDFKIGCAFLSADVLALKDQIIIVSNRYKITYLRVIPKCFPEG